MRRWIALGAVVWLGTALGCETSSGSNAASTQGGAEASASSGSTGGNAATGGSGSVSGICGDGLRQGDEQCDDGDVDDGDGCSAGCLVEPDHRCRGEQPSVCLPLWPVDLVPWIEQLVSASPNANTEGLLVPTTAELSVFRDASGALLADEWSAAAAAAMLVGYQAVLLQDTAVVRPPLLALVPDEWSVVQPFGGDGRGVFITRPVEDSGRNMVLEAPHPRHDNHTAVVAAMAFRQLRARALAVSGSHRCANMMPSLCSGTTGACGASGQPYRESDMAHVAGTFFQVFHEMAAGTPPDVLLQVHGMSSANDEPIASISDGTSANVADERYASNRLADVLTALASAAGSGKVAGSCNRSGDPNLLCGSTNTQGRFSNGVPHASVCSMSSGASASGRFMHAELAPELRDPASSMGPQLFIDALASVF